MSDDRARRKDAIDYARGSVRLEGFVMSDYADELSRRYIDGEITSAEHSEAIRAHWAAGEQQTREREADLVAARLKELYERGKA